MYYNFFSHLFVNGLLGCSHILPVVNCAAVNAGMSVKFPVIVLSGYSPRSEIAGLCGSSIFQVFLGTSLLFSIVAAYGGDALIVLKNDAKHPLSK